MFEENSSLEALFEGESNFIANAANFASYFYHNLDDINWVGFYFYDGAELVLGPFCGKPACIRIAMGKGVCGTAAMNRETMIVGNVHDFPGHIPCDSASNSEIVVPIIYQNKLIGVLDLDSPKFNRFTNKEKSVLESAIDILLKASNVIALEKYYY